MKNKRKLIIVGLCAVGLISGLFFILNEDSCNVAYIPLRGEIVNYIPPEYLDENGSLIVDAVSSEDIRNSLLQADADDTIDAILISLDSFGGGLVAGQEISDTVLRVRKPVIVSVGTAAVSAGYYAITAADRIFASPYSDIGSIAITTSYLDEVEKNRKEGLAFVELTSGKFKETGNPSKTLSFEEKAVMQKQLGDLHKLLVKDIAEKRKIPQEQVAKLADGSVLTGTEALAAKLIDENGSIFDAIDWLREKFGRADICWNY